MEVKWFAFLLLTALGSAQTIAPLAEPPHHAKQELVVRFNEILTHPQDTEKTAWEWYTFTDDSGWRVGGYNWAVVKWNEGFHTTAIDYFKWLSNHCEGQPEVCRRARIASRGK